MKFFCDQCNAQYMIADEKVGPRGVKVKCKKCSHVIVVKPAGGDATTVDTSGAAASSSPAAEQAAAPAPKKAESEISGAFDSLFGGGGQQSDSAWSNNQTVIARAPASAAASEKEWYVAIDEAQVGPIDIAEIQQKWDAKEISEDSLAWKAGMPDWIPVADIPQLSYLTTERPQKKAVAGGALGNSSSSPAAGSAVAKASAPVEWKPSAASALSSLVQEELIASQAPKDTGTKPPEGVPDLGLSGFGTNDLFGGKVGGSPAPVDSMGGGGGGAAWSVPSSRPSSGNKGLYALIGGVIVVLLVLAGAVLFMLAKSNQAPKAVATVAQAPAAAPAAPAAAPAAAPVAAAAPAATAAAPAAAAAAGDEEDDDKHPGKHRKAKHVARPGGGGGGQQQAAADTAPEAPAAAAKAALSKDDIWNVVRANAANAAPCLKAARGRNEIPAGKYTFTLDWVIKPNGGVSNPQLKGPPAVLGTSLPNCFASIIGQWHFPASQAGAPIANFPFGPINVP